MAGALQPITLLDGGLGQEIYRRSELQDARLWSVEAMLRDQNMITSIHREFIAAGAKVCVLNTYTATPLRLKNENIYHRLHEVHQIAYDVCHIATQEESDAAVDIAGCLPPLEGSYRGTPTRNCDELISEYEELCRSQSMADVLLIETMTNGREALAACMAASGSGKPYGLSFRLEQNGKLRSGETLEEIIQQALMYKPTALLLNCTDPEVISKHIAKLGGYGLPFGAYGNGFLNVEDFASGKGTVNCLQARKDLSPEKYADFVMDWIDQGATIVGGCCEIGPAHMKCLSETLQLKGHPIVGFPRK
jgi:S-methylmethionine-dependent homocysteine/selenocysteine methylase